MYEFRVKLKGLDSEITRIGMAKWLGTVKEGKDGVFRPLFEVKFEDGTILQVTQDELEFIDKPLIL